MSEGKTLDRIAELLTLGEHKGFPTWEVEKNTGVTEYDAWEFVGYKPDGESTIENRLRGELAAELIELEVKIAEWATQFAGPIPEPGEPEGGK